jgi:hypothetical protein
MATSPGTSNLKNPWAWLTVVVVFDLVLALSTALYAVSPAVYPTLPWWAAVVTPALVYALVLPVCVPRIRVGGWLAGVLILALLHVGIALATARLYSTVRVTSSVQALRLTLGGFPPALVLAMIGSLVMALPFLGLLAPRAAAPRRRAKAAPLQEEATLEPRPAFPDVIPDKDRRAWARRAGAELAAHRGSPAPPRPDSSGDATE